MKTKKQIWTSFDERLEIEFINNGRGIIAVLKMYDSDHLCENVYSGFVASELEGHLIVFFPMMGRDGMWVIPSLYDKVDDRLKPCQWLYDADRYRLAVDNLRFIIDKK